MALADPAKLTAGSTPATSTKGPTLSALVVIHNEEDRLAECLERLRFADEIVVVLDRCTDRSREIALSYTDRLVEGAWDREAGRRNAGIDACRGDWILDVDADELVSPALAAEIRSVVSQSTYDRHVIPVDNYIGKKLVRYGWAGSFGKSGTHGLYRKGMKRFGEGRVHPKLDLGGSQGPHLKTPLDHMVDRNISDMLKRLDRYTTARAQDLREQGDPDSTATYVRRAFTRFYKSYVHRGGYKEGAWGLLVGIFAGLYPLLSHLKAKLEREPGKPSW